jgi:hypothetical protein
MKFWTRPSKPQFRTHQLSKRAERRAAKMWVSVTAPQEDVESAPADKSASKLECRRPAPQRMGTLRR